MREDHAELAAPAAALALTLCLVIMATRRDILAPERLPVEAPKPTQVTLSMVEEPPPPPPPPPPPVAQPPQPLPPPDLPPPPLQATPSPLPPPPPPRPRHHLVRPRHLPLRPAPQTPTPPLTPPQSPAAPRPPSQAPENHSADAAYVGRLHAAVEANTRPPDSPAFRLAHSGGEVTVAFLLSRSGGVSDVHVLRSSGSSLIDRQGVLIVSATRYPPMPPDVFPGQSSHPFTVPVRILPPPGTGDL